VLERHFAQRVSRNASLQALLHRAFPEGLQTPVSKRTLFTVLRIEEQTLELRAWALLDGNDDGWVTLEELLTALARAAAGQPLRVRQRGAQPAALPAPCDWETAPGALRAQAAFAFALYDLNDNGRLSCDEVCTLCVEVLGCNMRSVDTTLRAVGAVHNGFVTLDGFVAIAQHASNFLYPAFRLQSKLSKHGADAREALTALRELFAAQGSAPSPYKGHRKQSVGYDFGEEGANDGAPSSQQQQQQQQHSGRDCNAGAHHSVDGLPSRSFDDLVRAEEQAMMRHGGHRGGVEAERWEEPAPCSEAVIGAFRAARLGRMGEVEGFLSRGEVAVDAVHEPHRATLLHVAAAHGHRAMCRRLLALGAPLQARDGLGRSAAEVALAYRHWDTATALQATGVSVSPHAELHALRERLAWAQQRRAEQEEQAAGAAEQVEEWDQESPHKPDWMRTGAEVETEAAWQQEETVFRSRTRRHL